MLNVKRLGAAVFLMGVLELTALADCPIPGIMQGPPCISAAQATPDDSTAQGQMGTPTAVSEAVELPSLAEIALNILTLY
jgi:hypothetical protein